MAESIPDGAGGAPEQATQGQFGIQKIYVKDLSFETPNSPDTFQKEWNPSVNMDVANTARPLSDKLFEVVLSVTVTVRFAETTVYLTEVQQAGIFHIEGFPKAAVNRILATLCPNILFPFAREVVADLAMRGGFPQLLLAPMNFDALYAQHLREEAARAPADAALKH
ncbi:MAG: protein-export chaperone SecB [Gammaproteobacteria bacterium]|nr:protein-export chaperone SecB [Gammaproteobacteria bacterium]